MKYIRTKDGIYENKPLEKHLGKRKGKGFEIVFKEQDIINQANTIEELCDMFLVHELGFFDETLESLLEQCRYLDKSKIQIFGSIWADKGLMYVAKMNDEGELELL